MKKIFGVLAVSMLVAGVAQAVDYYGPTHLSKSNLDAVTVYGPANLNQVKADSVVVTGPVQFKDLEVAGGAEFTGPVTSSTNGRFGELKVTGPFDASQVQTGKLDVTGPVKVKGLFVSGDTEVIGPLDAAQSHFGNLTVNAEEINLDNVVVTGNVIVKDNDKKQTLYLKGSTVQGNINFESGKGTVVIRGGSSEVKGQVKGATLEK
ncbi:MAG TPA: hypothetical protein VHE99_07335 [Gammaproteobacteria bacterium]|nr:hypothetical protein [Gammaproteobacteria bacterium]